MNEIWKDIDFIEGFEGLYQVSNMGYVKSLARVVQYPNSCFNKTNKGVYRPEKILKTKTKRYCNVTLSNGGNLSYQTVHRLVAFAFIPNPENKPCVNHINGIKTDNRVENLEWINWDENVQHAYDTGLSKPIYGKKNHSYRHGKYAKTIVKQ